MKVSLPPKMRTSLHGFTLIEMLVSIGLIAILASLITPALSGMKQGSKETLSLQQLKQIGTAMQIYAGDNQQKFPPGYFYDAQARPREKTWASELLSYMGLPWNYYHAQGNPFVSPTSAVTVRTGVNAAFTPFTYSVNAGLSPDISLEDTRPRISAILRPSEIILVGDGSQLANTYAAATLTRPPEITGRTAASQTVDLNTPIAVGPDMDHSDARGWLRYRNRGHAACVMVDGHAQLFAKGSIRYRNVIFNR